MASHSEAAARRLAQLSAELEAVRATEGWRAAEVHEQGAAESFEETTRTDLSTAGRHAARTDSLHSARSANSLLPAGLRGRMAFGPGQIAVVAVLVTIGIALTAWWLIRADGTEISALPVSSTLTSTDQPGDNAATPGAPPPATSAGAAPTPTAPGSTVAAAAEGEVVVDVAGRVRRPGIVVLPAGSRVVDAVQGAGGARRGVALTTLNLARLLIDGEQILVGVRGAPGLAASAASSPGAGPTAAGELVNINTADQTQLEELPEVGPVTAAAIVSWRTEHGGFSAVEELLEVDGIGEVTLARIAPHATI